MVFIIASLKMFQLLEKFNSDLRGEKHIIVKKGCSGMGIAKFFRNAAAKLSARAGVTEKSAMFLRNLIFKEAIIMHTKILFMLIILVFGSQALWAEEPEILGPVTIFSKNYGTEHMDKVADVVTPEFRNGKCKFSWSEDTFSVLDFLEYESLESEIMGYVMDESLGYVHVRAVISTVYARVEQEELYRMIRKEGDWLIDALEVFNEKVQGREKWM